MKLRLLNAAVEADHEEILDQIDLNQVVNFFGQDAFLSFIDDHKMALYLDSGQRYTTIKREDGHKFVDIEKSIGTEPFYELIVKAIEEGRLSLELIVGKVATNKLMKQAGIQKTE